MEDDGKGFDPANAIDRTDASQGLGFRGMQERLALIGGRLILHTRPAPVFESLPNCRSSSHQKDG